MIYDHIANNLIYRPAHPGFALAFAYLAEFDPETKDGKYELDGDRVIAHVQSYRTAAPGLLQYESHREYLDLQFVARGEEIIYHSRLDKLVPTDSYDPVKDGIHYRGEDTQALVMRPGDFAVLYPQDGHKARCILHQECDVKKVVFKIRAAHADGISHR